MVGVILVGVGIVSVWAAVRILSGAWANRSVVTRTLADPVVGDSLDTVVDNLDHVEGSTHSSHCHSSHSHAGDDAGPSDFGHHDHSSPDFGGFDGGHDH